MIWLIWVIQGISILGITSVIIPRERLDRAVASSGWADLFPAAQVHHISTRRSDHDAILVRTNGLTVPTYKPKRRFMFESMWLRTGECQQIVSDNWAADLELLDNIDNCRVGD